MQDRPLDIFDRILELPPFKRFARQRSAITYLFFGGCTTIVSVLSFLLIYEYLHIDALIANVISWILAVAFAYLTNRRWVFFSQAQGKDIFVEACSFVSGRLATLGIEELIIFVFVSLLQLSAAWVKIGAQVVVLVLNYLISKLIVFKS